MSESPLRLGVWCAVTKDGALLLSRRSDLNVWALPGGRLDSGESLLDAAAREVEEETGVLTADLHPVGMYYLDGWRRMNVLFAGRARGGELLGRTDETRGNRFFPLEALPRMPLRAAAEDAAAGLANQMCVLHTPRLQMLRLRARFALRYVENALRGRPEPVFPHFTVSAAAVITEPASGRVLTLPGEISAAGQLRALPRVSVYGGSPPWEQVSAHLAAAFGVNSELRWAGLWQDAAGGALELVFVGRSDDAMAGDWTAARLAALEDRDSAYLARMSMDGPVWFLETHASANHDRALPGKPKSAG
ncbi:MAG TPA: NUDIX domain-containing protein [Candidatus Limnocylindrales bacterium]|nr:NUDIX domain-containing protein [Candidatus Limnocylindrales bacterium]